MHRIFSLVLYTTVRLFAQVILVTDLILDTGLRRESLRKKRIDSLLILPLFYMGYTRLLGAIQEAAVRFFSLSAVWFVLERSSDFSLNGSLMRADVRFRLGHRHCSAIVSATASRC